jgi:HAD superfamily hydrolase (TIGR01509 family)
MSCHLEAVIFDLDGLILDVETPDYLSWKEAYNLQGLELTADDWRAAVGCPASDLYGPLSALGTDPAALRQARHGRLAALQDKCLQVRPGFGTLVTRLMRAGIRRGLASNSSFARVQRVITLLGICDFLDAMAGGDEVARRKPAPDLYLLAALRLGVEPRRCAAVEDSQQGIEAAKAAGLACIAVPNLFTQHQDLSQADLTLASLDEITIETLRALELSENRSPDLPV